MAGQGPAPSESRRHRAAPSRGDWVVLSSEPFAGEKPDLRLPLEGKVGAFTQRAWGYWWASPMAHQWTQAEWPLLLRLAALTEIMVRGMSESKVLPGAVLSEIRQLEDRLGISEKGRRDLRWKIEFTDLATSRSGPKRSASAMRSRLSLVDG